MAEVYPAAADQSVPDVEWLAKADTEGWVVLTKDERIIRYPKEVAALSASGLRVFAIGNQNLTGPVMADYLMNNINRIVRRSRKPGPFVDVILKNSVERRWPRPGYGRPAARGLGWRGGGNG